MSGKIVNRTFWTRAYSLYYI